MTEEERTSLESRLGYHFESVEWLERALRHRSHTFVSSLPHNERLEYLGDSVLGLAVSRTLVTKFLDWDEGRLSKARARLVSSASAAEAAVRLQLGENLRLGAGEEKTGGRKKQHLLGNAYEAIVGAIFRDGGFEAAAGFVERSLLCYAFASSLPLAEADHKSALQEWLQSRGQAAAEYHVVREYGPEHEKTFVVSVRVDGRDFGKAEGRSKKSAEQFAAEQALRALRAEQEAEEPSNA